MAIDKPWIKLWRQILTSDLYINDQTAFRVFLHLLLSADDDGLVVTSQSEISKTLAIARGSLPYILERLVLQNRIEKRRSSIFASSGGSNPVNQYYICNWEHYQGTQKQPFKQPIKRHSSNLPHIEEVQEENIYIINQLSAIMGVEIGSKIRQLIKDYGNKVDLVKIAVNVMRWNKDNGKYLTGNYLKQAYIRWVVSAAKKRVTKDEFHEGEFFIKPRS